MEFLEKIDELLLKVEIRQTSIIFGRNLVKQKKSKSETKKRYKIMGCKETEFILIFKLSFLFIYIFDIAK